MEFSNWTDLAAPGATVAAVTLLITICKAALGMYWSTTINGIGCLVFGVFVSVATVAGVGYAATSAREIAAIYALAIINGLIYAGAVLGVNQRFSAKVKQD
jgi:hypothetical protein